MFGHQDNQDHHDDKPLNDILSEPAADAVLSEDQPSGAAPANIFSPDPAPVAPMPEPTSAPAAPADSPAPTDDPFAPDLPVTTDGVVTDNSPAPDTTGPAASPDPVPATPASASPVADDLLSIKQQALGQLSPLVGHLEQTPEEKFRTTMMMIQAADNQQLIPVAYEAAQAIGDEKAKAQALLDVINEINYFTQNPKA